jgi:hypothetical protein
MIEDMWNARLFDQTGYSSCLLRSLLSAMNGPT